MQKNQLRQIAKRTERLKQITVKSQLIMQLTYTKCPTQQVQPTT